MELYLQRWWISNMWGSWLERRFGVGRGAELKFWRKASYEVLSESMKCVYLGSDVLFQGRLDTWSNFMNINLKKCKRWCNFHNSGSLNCKAVKYSARKAKGAWYESFCAAVSSKMAVRVHGPSAARHCRQERGMKCWCMRLRIFWRKTMWLKARRRRVRERSFQKWEPRHCHIWSPWISTYNSDPRVNLLWKMYLAFCEDPFWPTALSAYDMLGQGDNTHDQPVASALHGFTKVISNVPWASVVNSVYGRTT